MRTPLLILLTSFLVAACSDSHPSSPLGARSTSAAAHDATSIADGIMVPQAKPTDQVGFTKITRVVSSTVVAAPNTPAYALVICPSGTTIVGGGHHFLSFAPSAPPFVATSADNEINQWVVYVSNSLPGAASASFQAFAYCAS